MNSKILTGILVIVALALGLTLGLLGNGNGISQDEVDYQIANITEDFDNELAGKDTIISEKDLEILSLNDSINELIAETDSDNEISDGYLIDELFLGNDIIELELTDRNVKKLLDGEIEFDNEDYDFEEFVILNAEVSINEEDFADNAYFSVLENGIEYKVEFEEYMDSIGINESETLKFKFLGKDVEVSNWDNEEITLVYGNDITMNEGETLTIDGSDVAVELVTDTKAWISVNGETKSFTEGDTITINKLEVKVKDIMYQGWSDGIKKVIIVAGSNIEETIKSGDKYAEDSIWEYVITSNSMGLRLVKDFDEIDEDEEFNALGKGDSICLPNDYVCVKYNGLSDEDVETYKFELDGSLIEIDGKFEIGSEDYEGRIYFNETGFSKDKDFEDGVIEGKIFLGNSDLFMHADDDNNLVINGSVIVINSDFGNMSLGNGNVSEIEDNYRTVYGIIVKSFDFEEDKELTLHVPMNKLEASISVY